MGARQTVNSGLNTILIAAAVVFAPFCIFLVGVSVYFDISKIYGGFIVTLGAILFSAGVNRILNEVYVGCAFYWFESKF